MMKPYRELSPYLRERLGGKTVKICIDGGFTCPNRDGTRGRGGCLFCGARGAGEFVCGSAGVAEAITAGVTERLRHPLGGRRADRFLAYFQNFTGTYAPPAVLRERYDAALCDERVVGLAIATRADCVTEEIADLLAGYAERMYVSVELGLQTASDTVAEEMHMACPRAAFPPAVSLLSARGIDTVAHILAGLPGEKPADVLRTGAFVNRHPFSGIKVHSLYVIEGSELASWWRAGRYRPWTEDAYVATVAELLARARPDLVVHRLTGDPPRETLLAPDWCREKNRVRNEIVHCMMAHGWEQGCLYIP